MPNRIRCFPHLGILLAALGFAGVASADDHERHATRAPLLPEYRQECGACHVPFPPRLLPAASWKQLMNDLGRHFGNDASLEADAAERLADWLAANTGRGESPPEQRITNSRWFRHEHDDVDAATWKLAAVKTPANCTACHSRADQGSFSEREIRIPRL